MLRRPMGRMLGSRPVRRNAFSKLARSIGPSVSDRRGRSPGRRPVGLKRKGRGKGLRVAPRPEPERTLEDSPLFSGGTSGPLSLKPSWEEKLHDPLRRSFVSFRGGAFEEATLRKWWGLLADGIKWEKPMVGKNRLPRSAAWLTTNGCTCEYKYGSTAWPTRPMERWFLDLTDEVCRACGVKERPNSCNANFYDDGGESVGWHADDEPLFEGTKRDTLIISLSLGEGRAFELCPNDDPEDVTSILLRNGDICTMEGLCQRHYKHRVPREPRVRKARINLTWRWVVAHERGCPASASPVLVSGVPADDAAANTEGRAKKARQLAEARAARGTQRTARAPAEESDRRPLEAPLSSEELAKRKRRAERFGGAPAIDPNAATSVVRSTLVGIEVSSTPDMPNDDGEEALKKKRRAEKYGGSMASGHEASSQQVADVPSSEDARRKRLRAERFATNGPTTVASSTQSTMDKAPEVSRSSSTSEYELKKQERAKRFGENQEVSSTKQAIPDSAEGSVVSRSTSGDHSKNEAKATPSELSEAEKRKLRAARWK